MGGKICPQNSRINLLTFNGLQIYFLLAVKAVKDIPIKLLAINNYKKNHKFKHFSVSHPNNLKIVLDSNLIQTKQCQNSIASPHYIKEMKMVLRNFPANVIHWGY